MRTGTKSLLFGVHQFFIHPVTVAVAWRRLFGKWPSWQEGVCIVIHDWGYWGKDNMDDKDGERHPEFGARLAHRLLDGWSERSMVYHDLCLYHSRHYARNVGAEPSLLCWADKTSILCEAWWTYLPRAWASGELAEYRRNAADAGILPLGNSHRQWFALMRDRLGKLGREQRGDAVSYVNSTRNMDKP
jgi:hypothetical protein